MTDSEIIQHVDMAMSAMEGRLISQINAASSHRCSTVIRLETQQVEHEKREKRYLIITGLIIAAFKSYLILKKLIP